MDPVSAIGLASGILTFLQAGLKLTKVAYEIQSSHDGVLYDNRHRESITNQVKEAVERLGTENSGLLTPEQQSVYSLAKKCQVLSTELIDVLNDIKPKDKTSNLLKAWKATRREDQLKDLDRRLGDLRSQLTMALVGLARSEAISNFQGLLSLSQKNATQLEILTQALDNLRHGEILDNITNIGNQACDQLQRLLGIDKEAHLVTAQQRVLKILRFGEMRSRYNAVHDAHQDTFKWIFEPVAGAEDCFEIQQESRERFMGWLSSQTSEFPIFHISGKLGSGKSTLMKFLYCHRRTQGELQNWAGSKSLVFTSFFFWRNGLPQQRSLFGLCRSLLHDVLEKRPDLMADIIPEYWNTAKQAPRQIQDELVISKNVIKSALQRLLNNKQVFNSHRFCFFIDGLDEFEPGADGDLDYIDLVKTLRLWVVRANGNLKLCVSSREEPVFMTEYEQDPSFRLQDLTKFDMHNYVRDRLTAMRNIELGDNFVFEITYRSSGVFLWTYLVVKNIRDKLSHRTSDAVLKEQLESLPRGVQALFEHVLNNLEPKDQVKALRTIHLLPIADSHLAGFSLLAFSFLDDYEKDPTFSLRNDLNNNKPDETALQMQLRGVCGGLMECYYDHNRSSHWLTFVHRSVPDMLQTNTQIPELNSRMKNALDGWDAIDAISHLSFAAIRVSDASEIVAKRDCKRIVRMRFAENVDQPPYRFLEYMTTWIDKKWPLIPQPNRESSLKNHSKCVSIITNGRGLLVGSECTGPILHKFFLCTTSLAADACRPEFFEWKARNNPNLTCDALTRPLITQAVLESWSWHYFFQYPLISNHHKSNLIPDPFRRQDYDYNRFSARSDPLTTWQIYVTRFLLSDHGYSSGYHAFTWSVLERFLQQGVDSYCEIQIGSDGHAAVWLSICFQKAKIHYRDEGSTRYGVEIALLENVVGHYQRRRCKTRPEWGQNFNEVFSLREVIASYEFGNRSRLLELLDHNERRPVNSIIRWDFPPILALGVIVNILSVLCLLISIKLG